MSHCLLHPQTAAAGACELCDQPHCTACLEVFLGRRYCPPCLQRVRSVAGGKSRTATAAPAGHAPPGDRALLPGWASVSIFLLVWYVLGKLVAESLLVLPLLLAKIFTGRVLLERLNNPEATSKMLMDPTGIGLPLWCLLWGVIGWGSLLVTLAITAGFYHWLERKPLKHLGLEWTSTLGRDLFAGLALATVLFISVVGVGAAQNLYFVRNAASAVDAMVITVVGFFLLLPMAAVEEITMRGYVLQVGARSWGTAGGVAASTAAFTALHATNPGFREHPLAILGLALAGLYLASAYLITKNLWLPIFLHAGWNLLEGPVFGLPVSGIRPPATIMETTVSGPSLWTGGSFGPEAGLLLALLMLVNLAALWVMSPLLRPAARTGDLEPGPPQTDPPPPAQYRALRVD